MKAVFRKGLADLIGRGWQTVLILITVTAAAALLYVGLFTLNASTSPYERQMESTHSGHVWFELTGTADGKKLAARVARWEGVVESDSRMDADVELVSNEERTPQGRLVTYDPGRVALDRYLILEGEALAPGDLKAIVLNASLARYHNIHVGDQVRVATPTGPQALTVKGLSAESTNCQYPLCRPAALYVLPDTFQELVAGRKDIHQRVSVRLTNPASAETFHAQVEKEAGHEGDAQVMGGWTWLNVRQGYNLSQSMSAIFLMAFAVTAVAAAALITANIIGGAVLRQYREIGVLKAVGFTGAQIFGLFVGQNLVLGFAGGLVGALLGHWMAVAKMKPLVLNMGTPDVLAFSPVIALAVVAATVVISGLFAAFAAWRGVVVRPADVLSEGFASPRIRTPALIRLLRTLRAPAPIVLGIKDAVMRPGRAVLTVLSLMLCVVTIAMSINIGALVRKFANDSELHGLNFDVLVSQNFLTFAETESVVSGRPDVAAYYTQYWASMTVPDHDISFQFRGMGGNWRAFRFPILEGRMIERPDEIMLAPGAMDRMGVKLGDTLRLQNGTRVKEFTIVGKYRDMDNGGMMGRMLLEPMSKLVPDVRPAILVKLKPGTTRTAFRQSIWDQTQHKATVELPDTELPSFILDVMAMVQSLSAVMAGIAVLSVMSAALLTAREQMKEVGIRKAIGMVPAQIIAASGIGGSWLGLVGALLGLPLGMLLNQVMVSAMTKSFGVGSMDASFPPLHALLLVLGGAVVAALATLPAAIWASRLMTAQVLHAE